MEPARLLEKEKPSNIWEVGRLTVYSRIKVSSMIAGTQVTSNIPIAWFLVLGCNRQARVSKIERPWMTQILVRLAVYITNTHAWPFYVAACGINS